MSQVLDCHPSTDHDRLITISLIFRVYNIITFSISRTTLQTSELEMTKVFCFLLRKLKANCSFLNVFRIGNVCFSCCRGRNYHVAVRRRIDTSISFRLQAFLNKHAHWTCYRNVVSYLSPSYEGKKKTIGIEY